jgi:hypothetical protein
MDSKYMITARLALATALLATTLMPFSQQAWAVIPGFGKVVMNDEDQFQPKAPMVASGENLYIVWWTNKSGNWEVMFRASNDFGETIGDKINLSNSSDSDSQNAEIVAQDDNVYVSWWETSTDPANKTSESVLRISNDNGNTFGPVLVLGNNGTLTGGGGGQGQGQGQGQGAGAATNVTTVQ